MSLEKITLVDQIEIVENGNVQIRTKTVISENGEQISESFQRRVIEKAADVSGESAKIQAICGAAWS